MSGELEIAQLCARVLELEAKVEFLYRHLDVAYVEELSEKEKKVADVLRKGNMLEAIKVYRELYDVDLGSAKQAVEEIKSMLRL